MMKTFLQTHKWIGWLVFLLGLVISYTTADTGAHVLLAAGGVLLLITHGGDIGALLRQVRYDSGARVKALVIGAIGVVAVVVAVSGGVEADRSKDAAYARRQSVTSTAKYTFGFKPITGGTVVNQPDVYVPSIDTPDPAPVPKVTMCFACHGSGRCNLCDGTGTYRNYGESSDCSCDDGACSTCGGKGYY